ncbi:MAG TPA: GTP-binding protein [Cellvibrionaceae bacterium]|nr:GTP-binding protein [Cellvibrionaceae bacterium]HMW48568.1 GTP-binding protein [Cellvibrionaceae bacterium]HMW71968.1 GTP-binding protein [Cellvibrionaceae bacterium]HMY37929.1 GTP-binding protein [Marinagarivorans sp.]HNG58247.1 GTP-binding protein [Cellvibrionaceae bacterium]
MAWQAIPTNIITGFLGAGKTTAILHWLKHKPADEYWAVLVNEFGEVGIDGALLKGRGAMIKEIPGGCMCCVAGLPMQVGLNRLIAEAKPARILIEPTGLGHPAQIVAALTSPPFDKLLKLQASLCLIDPRKVQDARYLEHETFQAQAALADVLVASKVDLASQQDMDAFEAFADNLPGLKHRAHSQQGDLDLAWLTKPYGNKQLPTSAAHASQNNPLANRFLQLPAPAEGELFIRKQNQGQGFYSCGWVFRPEAVFAMEPLFIWLSGLVCQRVKGVMITTEAIIGFNAEEGVLSMNELDECDDSRLEIIHPSPLDWDAIEQVLLSCLAEA